MAKDKQHSSQMLENTKSRTEMEVLCLSARVQLSDTAIDRLEHLLSQPLDWDYLIRLARYHKVSLLLHRTFSQLGHLAVPDAVMKEMSLESKIRTIRNLFMTRELVSIVVGLQQAGITAIPFKGPVLAHTAYGDLSLRSAADLDIWVRPDRRKEVQKWLEPRGFELIHSLPWECLLRNAKTKIDIDLHESLAPVQFPIKLGFDQVASRLQPIEIAGNQINQLSPEDTLTVQCIGWCKDAWGWSAKLSQLCDIAELVRSHPDLDWKYIEQSNQKLDTHLIVSVPLLLAHDWLDSPLPDFISRKNPMKEFLYLRRLSQYASQQFWQHSFDLDTAAPMPFSTRDHTFYFGIRTDLAARANYIIKQVFISTEKEREIVNLPVDIPGLYVLIRLLRLLRKYAEHYIFKHS